MDTEEKLNEPSGRERLSSNAKSRSKLFSLKSLTDQRPSPGIPNIDPNNSFTHFSLRNLDSNLRPNYHTESRIEASTTKYNPNDNADVPSRGPSYTKFKIPYPMICSKRYRDSIHAYEAQLRREIRQNIDFQSTAADAAYFVRCMAITSFWPPLHNMSEVKHTGKHFFQLTEEERWRLQIIMNTNQT